jgi:predicted CopG family antitoxin
MPYKNLRVREEIFNKLLEAKKDDDECFCDVLERRLEERRDL